MPDHTSQLVAQVRDALASGRSLRPAGRRSKPWMAVASDELLSLAGHEGILQYDPAELVVTVRAGTSLSELDDALAEKGQMLAMDSPDFNGNSTIGGAVALGWGGSRSVFAGSVRDTVLGVRMINGQGEDLRFGGQVMKNVAGFDVSRLMAGSCGLLGVLLELSLKVVPRPQLEMTFGWQSPDVESMSVQVDSWTRRGIPVTGASFEHGRARVRLSGPSRLLDELCESMPGEQEDGQFWDDLRRLSLPLFHHGWGDEKLFDGNGSICWTAHTRRSGNSFVDLGKGPDLSKTTNAALMSRVIRAFDPNGLFQPVAA